MASLLVRLAQLEAKQPFTYAALSRQQPGLNGHPGLGAWATSDLTS